MDSVVGRKLVEKKKLNNLAMWTSIHAPDGKTGSKKETTWGNQSFWKLIRFLYFWVCLYTFCYI